MTKPPDPGFTFWSPESARTRGLPEIVAELRREIGRRKQIYPARVDAGRMTAIDAAAEVAVIAAILAEMTWWNDGRTGFRPVAGLTWAQKVNGLRREIMIRRNTFPQLVADLRLTEEDARVHIELIEAAHAWYWHYGLDFMTGETPATVRDAIRAEIDRRWGWAIEHGFNPDCRAGSDALWHGDWSQAPRLKPKEQAA